jgi:hypothetical protein
MLSTLQEGRQAVRHGGALSSSSQCVAIHTAAIHGKPHGARRQKRCRQATSCRLHQVLAGSLEHCCVESRLCVLQELRLAAHDFSAPVWQSRIFLVKLQLPPLLCCPQLQGAGGGWQPRQSWGRQC